MRLRRFWLVAPAVALVVSAGMNVVLYRLERSSYRQLCRTLLDPLGLAAGAPGVGQAAVPGDSRATVVFLGDSRARRWPAPEIEGYRFVNLGVEGQTSAQVLGRFDVQVTPTRPHVIVLQVGVNDLKTVPLFPGDGAAISKACEANIAAIVNRSSEIGAQVILTTILPIGRVPLSHILVWRSAVPRAIDSVNGDIRALSGENVVVWDAAALMADERGRLRREYSIDHLHLSTAGYEALNRELVRVLAALEQ